MKGSKWFWLMFYFYLWIFEFSEMEGSESSFPSYGRRSSCSHSQAQLILGTLLGSHRLIGVTIEVSKTKKRSSVVFAPVGCLGLWIASVLNTMPVLLFTTLTIGTWSGERLRVDLQGVCNWWTCSADNKDWVSSSLWWVGHFSRGAYIRKYKWYEWISSAGLSVRENSSDSRDLWQGLFIWLYIYSTSLHYRVWTQDTCIVKLSSLGEF